MAHIDTDCPLCAKPIRVPLETRSTPTGLTLTMIAMLDRDGTDHHCPTREDLPAAA